MTPYYDDGTCIIYHADCRETDAWLDADILVTDPPYGRSWRQGDTNTARGWAPDRHDGIDNDSDTTVRDYALRLWGDRPAIVFGSLMLSPPTNTRHVLIYDKGVRFGFMGAVGGYRRNVEAVYLIGNHGSGLGGRSAIVASHHGSRNFARMTGHPHTKPVDVMATLIESAPPGSISDPFMGSGTTLRAAKDLGRKAVGVEIEERYCEIAARRLGQEVLTL